jgi:hypothetical protein
LTSISASQAAFRFSSVGKIEKRKAHRALHLEGTLAGEKDRCRMGVNALDRAPVMRGGFAEQR